MTGQRNLPGKWLHIPVRARIEHWRGFINNDNQYLELREEPSIWRYAVATILNHMKTLFPRELIMLHNKHDYECWR